MNVIQFLSAFRYAMASADNRRDRVEAQVVEDRRQLPSAIEIKPSDVAWWLRMADEGELEYLQAFYDEMRARDAHLDAETSRAEWMIAGSRIDILPFPPEFRARNRQNLTGEAARATDISSGVADVLLDPRVKLDRAVVHLMSAFWRGIAALQVVTEPDGKSERIVALEPLPAQRFRYAPNSTTLLVQRSGEREDVMPVSAFPPGQLIVFIPEWYIPSPAKRGAFRRILPFFAVRFFGVNWWSRFVELFGTPLRVGRYPKGDPTTKKNLQDGLKDAGSSGYAVIPKEADVELAAVTHGTGATPHERILDWTSREISKLILGATQTTDVQKGAGSHASAETHMKVVEEKAQARARMIASTLREQLVFPLVARIYGDKLAQRYTPEIAFRPDREVDLLSFSQAVKTLRDAGAGPVMPLSIVNEIGGIPVPEEGEPTFGLPQAPPDVGGSKAPGHMPPPEPAEEDDPEEDGGPAQASASRRWRGRPKAPASDLDQLEAWALSQSARAGAELIAPIRDIIDQAEREGLSLAQLYARVLHRTTLPPESPKLLDLLAAVQLEAVMRGFTAERRAN